MKHSSVKGCSPATAKGQNGLPSMPGNFLSGTTPSHDILSAFRGQLAAWEMVLVDDADSNVKWRPSLAKLQSSNCAAPHFGVM
jgi:hypothetical protein